ncbi:hypothetical protein C2G38_2100826 [Gigaspora rosea]|uniref:Uncharacterized protein n=1 Tax=Gigaspora rosea TaxID=44941 RepID=A0A397UUU4_9GLOM|nr:hypothetical protein C2G38_2100826 [Gigaspora rosea]
MKILKYNFIYNNTLAIITQSNSFYFKNNIHDNKLRYNTHFFIYNTLILNTMSADFYVTSTMLITWPYSRYRPSFKSGTTSSQY